MLLLKKTTLPPSPESPLYKTPPSLPPPPMPPSDLTPYTIPLAVVSTLCSTVHVSSKPLSWVSEWRCSLHPPYLCLHPNFFHFLKCPSHYLVFLTSGITFCTPALKPAPVFSYSLKCPWLLFGFLISGVTLCTPCIPVYTPSFSHLPEYP